MSLSPRNLIWIDLEMTGLDTLNDEILEIATIVTDPELNVLAEGPVLALHQPDERLAQMDAWNTHQHKQTGLVERVRESNLTAREAEQQTLDFLRAYVPAKASPMCGNCICQDRRFMHRLMPELEAHFHYRNLDVSTVKELASRWASSLQPCPKQATHRALDDVRESIAELRYYREQVFKI